MLEIFFKCSPPPPAREIPTFAMPHTIIFLIFQKNFQASKVIIKQRDGISKTITGMEIPADQVF